MPPTASPNARAWSITNRTRRATSRKRPASTRRPRARDARARSVRAARSASTHVRSSCRPRRKRIAVDRPDRRRAATRAAARRRSNGRRCSTWNAKRSSSPQPNSGRAQRADERELVARVVDRAQRHQEVADLATCRRRASSSRPGTEMPGVVERALEDSTSEVRAGRRMQMSPSRAGAPSVAILSSTGHCSSIRPRAAIAATSRRLARPQLRRPSALVVGVGLDAEQHDPAIVRGRAVARRVERRSTRAASRRTGRMSSPNTWLIHPSTGRGRRKLQVRSGAALREALARPRGTWRCRRAGSGRSTAWDRRRRTGGRASTLDLRPRPVAVARVVGAEQRRDLDLDRVGVLELVDQQALVALPEPAARRRRRARGRAATMRASTSRSWNSSSPETRRCATARRCTPRSRRPPAGSRRRAPRRSSPCAARRAS